MPNLIITFTVGCQRPFPWVMRSWGLQMSTVWISDVQLYYLERKRANKVPAGSSAPALQEKQRGMLALTKEDFILFSSCFLFAILGPSLTASRAILLALGSYCLILRSLDPSHLKTFLTLWRRNLWACEPYESSMKFGKLNKKILKKKEKHNERNYLICIWYMADRKNLLECET